MNYLCESLKFEVRGYILEKREHLFIFKILFAEENIIYRIDLGSFDKVYRI